MQGKGFEPTVEALFGKNGFFPHTLSKVLYWAVDKVPQLQKWIKISERHKVKYMLSYEAPVGSMTLLVQLTCVFPTRLMTIL